MVRKGYNQKCGLAWALDVLGGRWTILILRELLVGPRRFTDLEAGLPGIGSNLLTDRLKHLQHHGVARRTTLSGPVPVQVYELTEAGRAVEPALVPLVRWGWNYAAPEDVDRQASQVSWHIFGLRARFDAVRAQGVNETYEFRVDDVVFHARVSDGALVTRLGPATAPDIVVTTDEDTFLRTADSEDELTKAIETGAFQVSGSMRTYRRARRIFSRTE